MNAVAPGGPRGRARLCNGKRRALTNRAGLRRKTRGARPASRVSAGRSVCGKTVAVETQAPDAIAERRALDAQQVRRARLVAAARPERPFDQVRFHLPQARIERQAAG